MKLYPQAPRALLAVSLLSTRADGEGGPAATVARTSGILLALAADAAHLAHALPD